MPVIHGVGIGETMHGIAAVAERHECRRRDKAKGSENGDHHRRAEAKPGAQLSNAGEAYCLRLNAASLTRAASPAFPGENVRLANLVRFVPGADAKKTPPQGQSSPAGVEAVHRPAPAARA